MSNTVLIANSHVRQQHSYKPLLVTRHVLEQVMSVVDVFPRFKNSLLYFGRRSHEVEIAPPRFQSRLIPSFVEDAARGYGMYHGYVLG